MIAAQRDALVTLVQWATGVDDVAWETAAAAYRADPCATLGVATSRFEGLPEERRDDEGAAYHQTEVCTIDLQIQTAVGAPVSAHELGALASLRLAATRPETLEAIALGVDVRGVSLVTEVKGLSTNGAILETAVVAMEVAFGVADVDTSAASRYTIEQVEGLEGTLTRPDGSTIVYTETIPETLGD